MASALLVLAFPCIGIAEDASDDAVYDTGASDGTVFYGPVPFTFAGATTYEVGIVAQNAYDAAAYVLGYDPNSEQFTPEVKALLSNAETGTTFYGFAQNFSHPNPAGGIWNPEFWTTASTLYGAWRTWRGEYTYTGMIAARVALEAVLNGGTSGGGSSGPIAPVDGVVTVPCVWGGYPTSATLNVSTTYNVYVGASYDSSTNLATGGVSTDYYQNRYQTTYTPVMPESFEIRLSQNLIDSLSLDFDAYDYLLTMNRQYCALFEIPKGTYELFDYTNGAATYKKIKIEETARYFSLATKSGSGSNMYQVDNVFFKCINHRQSQSTISAGTYNMTGSTLTTGNVGGCMYYGFLSGGPDAGPVIPPTNWPEDEPHHIVKEPPVPLPEVPDDPSYPVVPVPGTDPVYVIPTPEDGPTYATPDLSAVLDAMDEHCIHLQNAIYGSAQRLWNLLSAKLTSDLSSFMSWLGDWLEVITDSITDGILHLENYLHGLAEWLADQFEFTFTAPAYDDSSIVSWLKKIWAKLGTGSIVTRPDDPVADPIGIGDWLGRLFGDLISSLMGLGAELLGGISEDLDALTGKFPFSIPWDIAAILVLFVSDPVTPVVEFPWYTVTTEGLVSTPVVVDCAPYDGYMVVVRTVELVIFGAGLAWRTKDVMEVLGSVGGDR